MEMPINKARKIAVLLIMTMASFCCLAKEEGGDERLNTLFKKIRCPTCEGQSIKESNTAAAEDIKKFVISEIKEGKTEEQIIASLREGFGEDIIFEPEFAAHNLMLWLAPLLVLLFLIYKKRKKLE